MVFPQVIEPTGSKSFLCDTSYFKLSGNTYIVMAKGTTLSTSFVNNEDFILRLTGLMDLTDASFNNTSDKIAL